MHGKFKSCLFFLNIIYIHSKRGGRFKQNNAIYVPYQECICNIEGYSWKVRIYHATLYCSIYDKQYFQILVVSSSGNSPTLIINYILFQTIAFMVLSIVAAAFSLVALCLAAAGIPIDLNNGWETGNENLVGTFFGRGVKLYNLKQQQQQQHQALIKMYRYEINENYVIKKINK